VVCYTGEIGPLQNPTYFKPVCNLLAHARMQVPLIRLQCGVNSYDWGKKGQSSAAARFAAATPSSDLSIQEDKPYAEA